MTAHVWCAVYARRTALHVDLWKYNGSTFRIKHWCEKTWKTRLLITNPCFFGQAATRGQRALSTRTMVSGSKGVKIQLVIPAAFLRVGLCLAHMLGRQERASFYLTFAWHSVGLPNASAWRLYLLPVLCDNVLFLLFAKIYICKYNYL